MHRWVVSTLLVASASFAAERAEACSPPPCYPSFSAPAALQAIPANTPAIVFIKSRRAWSAIATPGPPSLWVNGTPIATTLDGEFLRPASELPIGSVVLEWEETCSIPLDAGPVTEQLTFHVEPASPMPASLGKVSFTYGRGDVTVSTAAGSCTDQIDAALVQFYIESDPSLEKFRNTMRFVTRVDGADWAHGTWGDSSRGAPSPSSMEFGRHRHNVVFAACGDLPAGVTDRGVATGKHTVEISAEIAGAAPIGAQVFEIELTCDASTDNGPSGSRCVVGRSVADRGTIIAIAAVLAALRRRR